MSRPTTYTLAVPGRPLTTNRERNLHHHQRAAIVRPAREAWALAAKDAKLPQLDKVRITACPWLRGKRSQDVGACLPSVKAAIDGLVDAGVLADDTPTHVLSLSFLPPALQAETDELVLTIEVVE